MLNIDICTKAAEPLIAAGQTMAYARLPIATQSAKPATTASGFVGTPTGKVKVTDKRKEPQVTVEGTDFSIAFDRATGYMTRYTVGGVSLLGQGGRLRPNFWRAVTDNDMGATVQRRYKAWRNPVINTKSLVATRGKSGATVEAVYDMPEVKGHQPALRYSPRWPGAC